MKKAMALFMALSLSLSMTACGGSGGSADGSTAGNGGDGVSFTIFNSKSEIQEYLEEAAAKYSEENGVNIEVYYSNDTVAAHLSVKYASKEPYTLSMTDAKDIYTLGAEYGYDMSGQEWVQNTDYAITVDDKVLGYPVCIEARGMLYNADAIKNVTGEDFDPASITTLDEFTAFLDKLVAGGMEAPTAILKPDWSLGAHYLQQVYEERADVDGFVEALYGGTADLANDAKFNSLMDTFDVLMKYNAFAAGPISAEDEQVHQKMSEGEVAFQFGGCSKYFYIDNSEYTTDEQRAAASDFLNWLYSSEDGQKLISDTCGMVSAFSNNTVTCSNDLGNAVKQYVDAGKLVPNYEYDPDDHYSKVGASMQKYLAGQIDRAALAGEIEQYWSTVTPVEH